MKDDPIVEEVRQARAKLFAECNEDLNTLMDQLKAAEEQDKDRLVTWEAVQQKRQLDEGRQPTER